MSSVEDTIRNASSHNKELLSVLSETDYAPPALEQQNKYIDDINHELRQIATRIHNLEVQRQKELKDHEKYRDSVMKRFAYRVGGKTEKFEAKAGKEEREYFEALREEHQAKKHQQSLQSNLAEAQTQKANLESAASRHNQAQTDLDALYHSIFQGPTPGFPDEDAKESTASSALQTYHDSRTRLESEQQALDLLNQARARLSAAQDAMASARSASQMDMFGGGMMADMMERNALAKAESLSSEVQLLVEQARRMSPEVGAVGKANIAQGSLLGDVLFDSPFADYRFHQKIKAGQEQMVESAKVLQREMLRCKERVERMQSRLKVEGKRLETARVELQQARASAFERVSGGK